MVKKIYSCDTSGFCSEEHTTWEDARECELMGLPREVLVSKIIRHEKSQYTQKNEGEKSPVDRVNCPTCGTEAIRDDVYRCPKPHCDTTVIITEDQKEIIATRAEVRQEVEYMAQMNCLLRLLKKTKEKLEEDVLI